MYYILLFFIISFDFKRILYNYIFDNTKHSLYDFYNNNIDFIKIKYLKNDTEYKDFTNINPEEYENQILSSIVLYKVSHKLHIKNDKLKNGIKRKAIVAILNNINSDYLNDDLEIYVTKKILNYFIYDMNTFINFIKKYELITIRELKYCQLCDILKNINYHINNNLFDFLINSYKLKYDNYDSTNHHIDNGGFSDILLLKNKNDNSLYIGKTTSKYRFIYLLNDVLINIYVNNYNKYSNKFIGYYYDEKIEKDVFLFEKSYSNLFIFMKDNLSILIKIEIIIQLLYAYKNLYNLGIIHNDIKEQNILIKYKEIDYIKIINKEDYTFLEIIDFGLSYFEKSIPNSIVSGTILYYSMNKYDNNKTNYNSDFYSTLIVIINILNNFSDSYDLYYNSMAKNKSDFVINKSNLIYFTEKQYIPEYIPEELGLKLHDYILNQNYNVDDNFLNSFISDFEQFKNALIEELS